MECESVDCKSRSVNEARTNAVGIGGVPEGQAAVSCVGESSERLFLVCFSVEYSDTCLLQFISNGVFVFESLGPRRVSTHRAETDGANSWAIFSEFTSGEAFLRHCC